MNDKKGVIAKDPVKARLLELKKKPVLTAPEVKEAIDLMGISEG